MQGISSNKRKIINDPIYGFIPIPFDLIFDLIEHPFFQRLRRIKQLGLTHLVYPSAQHTRFQHALGAMFLMKETLSVLQEKGVEISKEETEGVLLAILLHDIGHGPFSHSMEHMIVKNVSHEEITLVYMQKLNRIFNNELSLAIEIFTDKYPKRYLHQLVSSQLDMDRLDYLRRDSFYTGVVEGSISTDRIIKMMNVVNDEIVLEEKGIYSIENFISSRRLMYWQVYLHKASLAAEHLILNIFKRAKYLASRGEELFCTPSFRTFLYHEHSLEDFESNEQLLEDFTNLDDSDIMSAVKVWAKHHDPILSKLCTNLKDRRLSKIEIQKQPFDKSYVYKIIDKAKKIDYLRNMDDISYFIFTGKAENKNYNPAFEKINILQKNNKIVDFTEASGRQNKESFSQIVTRHLLCYPKELMYI